jgi:hypothetical protein
VRSSYADLLGLDCLSVLISIRELAGAGAEPDNFGYFALASWTLVAPIHTKAMTIRSRNYELNCGVRGTSMGGRS